MAVSETTERYNRLYIVFEHPPIFCGIVKLFFDFVHTHDWTSFKLCITILRLKGTCEMTDEPRQRVSGDSRVG